MKKSLLVSCAVAGLVLGSQAVRADEHAKKKEEGKAGCKGKDAKEGKAACKTADGKPKDGSHGCGANGCEGKKEEKKQ